MSDGSTLALARAEFRSRTGLSTVVKKNTVRLFTHAMKFEVKITKALKVRVVHFPTKKPQKARLFFLQ